MRIQELKTLGFFSSCLLSVTVRYRCLPSLFLAQTLPCLQTYTPTARAHRCLKLSVSPEPGPVSQGQYQYPPSQVSSKASCLGSPPCLLYLFYPKIQASGPCFCLFTISRVCSHLSSLAACCALSPAPTIRHSPSLPPRVRLLSPLVPRDCRSDESPFPTSISSSSMTQQDSCPLTLLWLFSQSHSMTDFSQTLQFALLCIGVLVSARLPIPWGQAAGLPLSRAEPHRWALAPHAAGWRRAGMEWGLAHGRPYIKVCWIKE